MSLYWKRTVSELQENSFFSPLACLGGGRLLVRMTTWSWNWFSAPDVFSEKSFRSNSILICLPDDQLFHHLNLLISQFRWSRAWYFHFRILRKRMFTSLWVDKKRQLSRTYFFGHCMSNRGFLVKQCYPTGMLNLSPTPSSKRVCKTKPQQVFCLFQILTSHEAANFFLLLNSILTLNHSLNN